MSSVEIAKELTVALINNAGISKVLSSDKTAGWVAKSFKTIFKGIEEAITLENKPPEQKEY